MMKNSEAVSPIVATLILIIVAIVAAAAVMTFMNSYNTKVSNTANTQTDKIVNTMTATPISTALSGAIAISGSTTLYPSMNALAAAFHVANPGVTVTVTGSGSGAGYTDIKNRAVDMAMSSKATTVADFASYSDIQVDQVGARGIVFGIGNGNISTSHINVSKSTLCALFNASTAIATTTTNTAGVTIKAVATRADSSGTADDVETYLGIAKGDIYKTKTGKTGYTGNAGVYNAVKAGTSANPTIGFFDFGYYQNGDSVQLVDIYNDDNAATAYTVIPTKTNILDEINVVLGKTTTSSSVPAYDSGLVSGLYVIYYKPTTSPMTEYVSYIKAQAQSSVYDANGVFSMYDL